MIYLFLSLLINQHLIQNFFAQKFDEKYFKRLG